MKVKIIKIINDPTEWIEVRMVRRIIFYIYEIIVPSWMHRYIVLLCKVFTEEIKS